MAIEYEKLITVLEEIAPPELTESWDNSGVQIYSGKKYIHCVLLTLEMNQQVIDEAVAMKADMIITHHPLIFGGIDSIDAADKQTGSYIFQLIGHEISVYSAHLTFDNAPKGNNWYLTQLLSLRDVCRPEGIADTMPGLLGYLEKPMAIEEVMKLVEQRLSLPEHYIRVVAEPGQIVETIGLCSGAGGDFLPWVLKERAQLLLTGDVRFHEAQEARAKGLAVIDAGHYETEKIFGENFAKQLKEKVGGRLQIKETGANTNPYMI